MRSRRLLAVLVAGLVLVAGCGDDDDVSSGTTTTEAESTTSEPSTTSSPSGLDQPAIWPGADTVFSTPEEAAEDFVSTALGVPSSLGEFMQGDSRSGEIEVVFAPEDGVSSTVRSVLLLRQLGPSDGWYVLAAVNDSITIDAPESMAEVSADILTVEGSGRGFEGTLHVAARVAGAAEDLDEQIAQAGSLETPEPFSVELDLSSATAGDTVMVIVRGDVGHEEDPGEFSAIPVVIAD